MCDTPGPDVRNTPGMYSRENMQAVFQERLDWIMIERAVSSGQLATQLSVSRMMVHRYCKGEACPSIGGLFEIAKALGVNVSVFDPELSDNDEWRALV